MLVTKKQLNKINLESKKIKSNYKKIELIKTNISDIKKLSYDVQSCLTK